MKAVATFLCVLIGWVVLGLLVIGCGELPTGPTPVVSVPAPIVVIVDRIRPTPVEPIVIHPRVPDARRLVP